MFLKDEISIIKQNIDDIENNKEEQEYLLKVGDILFDYYDENNDENNNENNHNSEKLIKQNSSKFIKIF